MFQEKDTTVSFYLVSLKTKAQNLLVDPDQAPPSSTERINISAPHLEKLWTYGSSITDKYKVTCFAWNKSNEVKFVFRCLSMYMHAYMYVYML